MLHFKRASEVLRYEPKTGDLTWIARTSNRIRIGEKAGALDGHGYLQVMVDGRNYRAHRVVWLLVYGQWPAKLIDHVNGRRADNRISNLREATDGENHQNRGISSNNKSGVTGVHWHRADKKWRAHIKVNHKLIQLGRFESLEEAARVRDEAKTRLHTFHGLVSRSE